MNVGVDLGSSAVKVATSAGVLSMRGLMDPELSSRMGTTAPVVRHVGNALSLCSPHESYVLALSRVLGENPNPDDVTVVVPDWWAPRAQDMVKRTLAALYPVSARLVGAAPAALRAHRSTRFVAEPVVAVLDLGATCTSVTVVAADGDAEPQVVGTPLVLHGRGGDHLDALLLHHVLEAIVAGGWSHDRSDPDVLRASRLFQNDIRVAKEQFSTRPVVRFTPHLPGLDSELRVVRAEFDDVARPVISEIVGMLSAAIVESGADVGAVLLVGGGAPMPLLTQMLSVELGLPVLLDDEPASAAARGAMRFVLEPAGREKRSRSRGSSRTGGRGGRRATEPVRIAPAARIVSIPSRTPVAVMDRPETSVAGPTEQVPAPAPEQVAEQVPDPIPMIEPATRVVEPTAVVEPVGTDTELVEAAPSAADLVRQAFESDFETDEPSVGQPKGRRRFQRKVKPAADVEISTVAPQEPVADAGPEEPPADPAPELVLAELVPDVEPVESAAVATDLGTEADRPNSETEGDDVTTAGRSPGGWRYQGRRRADVPPLTGQPPRPIPSKVRSPKSASPKPTEPESVAPESPDGEQRASAAHRAPR